MSQPESGSTPGTEPRIDGRRAKGERRRRALIEATHRVVEREGVAGVSHRTIAREAGVPPASVAYYFASIDDLLVAALLEGVDAMISEIEALRETTAPQEWPWALARLLANMINEHRRRTVAEYELYLLAARRPALRPSARRWIEVAAGYINDGQGGDPGAIKALFAGIDGLLMHGLIADEPPTAEELEPALHYLLQPASYLRRIAESDAGDS